MEQTKNLAYWPLIGRLESSLLEKVDKFYICQKGGQLAGGFFEILITDDKKVYEVKNTVRLSKVKQKNLVEMTSLSGKNVIQMTSNLSRVMALTESGLLFTMIYEKSPKSGFELIANCVQKVLCDDGQDVAVLQNGKVEWHCSRRAELIGFNLELMSLKELSDVVDIESNNFNTFLALTSQNELFIFGSCRPTTCPSRYAFKPEKIPLETKQKVISMAVGIEGFMLLFEDGKMRYYPDFRKERRRWVEVPAQSQPIQSITSRDNIFILVPAEGSLFMYDCETSRLVRTMFKSVPDAFCYYTQFYEPKGLVSLSREAIREYKPTSGFNVTATHNLSVHVGNPKRWKMFMLNRNVMGRKGLPVMNEIVKRIKEMNRLDWNDDLSPDMACLCLDDRHEDDIDMVHLKDFSIPSYYSYFYHLHSGQFEVQPDQLLELFLLSKKYRDDDLGRKCVRFLAQEIAQEDLVYVTGPKQSNVVEEMAKEHLNVANCCRFYQLAHLNNNTTMKHSITQFVKLNFQRVVKTKAYEEMDLDLREQMIA